MASAKTNVKGSKDYLATSYKKRRNALNHIVLSQSKRLIRALVLANIAGYSSMISFVTISLSCGVVERSYATRKFYHDR